MIDLPQTKDNCRHPAVDNYGLKQAREELAGQQPTHHFLGCVALSNVLVNSGPERKQIVHYRGSSGYSKEAAC